jgi:predicted RNase H-like HicB family nuclease
VHGPLPRWAPGAPEDAVSCANAPIPGALVIPVRDGRRSYMPTIEERFTVEISWKEDIEAYVARVPDIPELAAWDETQEVALKKVRKAIRANMEIAQEYGDPVPEPSDL